ncbi:mycofactocin-coupled SDR family oxidoreductase [Pseudonocardia xishanensis]|uniref:Mycofactocin-coupled SDR family oxidoreductase n=1 Tax=Pseudonocardia xishanensis TaxID=630995 RepID=A0ABP8S1W1_9PSEU
MGTLDGQVALITGGARGQGRAHAVALAEEGADVVLVDSVKDNATTRYPMASHADLEETVRMVEALDRRCTAHVLDVRDLDGMIRAADRTVAEYGRLDILVAQAGILTYGTIGEMSSETWNETIAINLTGIFHAMRAVIPHMRARGYGRIVATSSAVGHMGMQNVGHYSASKWGVLGLVKSAALELARDGITVNALAPTMVDTPMIRNAESVRVFVPGVEDPSEEQIREAFALNPMGVPWLDPVECARAMLFFVRPGTSYITGESVGPLAGAAAQNGAA